MALSQAELCLSVRHRAPACVWSGDRCYSLGYSPERQLRQYRRSLSACQSVTDALRASDVIASNRHPLWSARCPVMRVITVHDFDLRGSARLSLDPGQVLARPYSQPKSTAGINVVRVTGHPTIFISSYTNAISRAMVASEVSFHLTPCHPAGLDFPDIYAV